MSRATTDFSVKGMPQDLIDKGWELLQVQISPARFKARNPKMGSIQIGPCPTPEEMVTEVYLYTADYEEAAAIREESRDDAMARFKAEAGGHEWRKSCLVTQRGGFDTYRCEQCGATAKRYGVSWPPRPDKKKQETCPSAPARADSAGAEPELATAETEEHETIVSEAANTAYVSDDPDFANKVRASYPDGPVLFDDPPVVAAETPASSSDAPLSEWKVEKVRLSVIRKDGGTQVRPSLNQDVIDDYADKMKAGEVFPPPNVFEDDKDYWLADGFYRMAALEKAFGDKLIVVHVRTGTQRDAILYSCGANDDHGQPRTGEEKRIAAMRLLDDEEWSGRSDTWIAEKAHVSQTFVSNLRRILQALHVAVASGRVWSDEEIADYANAPVALVTAVRAGRSTQNRFKTSTSRTGRDGIVRDTSHIGRVSDEEKEKQSAANPALFEQQQQVEDVAPKTEFEEDSPEDLAKQTTRREVTGEWSAQDVADAVTKAGGSMFRGQIEELGCTYGAILGALHEETIVQPETGKYTLPKAEEAGAVGSKQEETAKPADTAASDSSPARDKASEAAAKPQPAIEELLDGRMLALSFIWIPKVPGVQVSVNASTDPGQATKELLSSDKAALHFGGRIREMIVAQLKGAPAKPASPAKPTTSSRKKPKPQKSAASKKPAKKAAKPAARSTRKAVTKGKKKK